VRLPTSALIFRENGLEVATIGPDNKIELKPITLGRNLGTEVEVLRGRTVSDRVVNSPPDSLSAGDTVRIAGQQSNADGDAETPHAENMSSAPESNQLTLSYRRSLSGKSASSDHCRNSADHPTGWQNTPDTHPADPAAAALPNHTAAKQTRGIAGKRSERPEARRQCAYAIDV